MENLCQAFFSVTSNLDVRVVEVYKLVGRFINDISNKLYEHFEL